VGVVITVNEGRAGSLGLILLRQMVPRSANRLLKEWTGRPSAAFLLEIFWSALWERWAGATGPGRQGAVADVAAGQYRQGGGLQAPRDGGGDGHRR
jgi:hypothetical protein